MRLSWSHKLFLRVNAQVGRSPSLDAFMKFCGVYLIWVMGLSIGLLFLWELKIQQTFALLNLQIGITTMIMAYLSSYAIAFFWPHERPEKELLQVKKLLTTFGTWKSFPSDHTIGAVLIVCFSFFLTWSWIVASIFLACAFLVAVGRVYCGVHYPRDVAGGVVVAAVSFALAIWFILSTGNVDL